VSLLKNPVGVETGFQKTGLNTNNANIIPILASVFLLHLRLLFQN
jgi:hypothetical protein